MQRRSFIKSTLGYGVGSSMLPPWNAMNFKDLIIGHGDHQYKVDVNWGALDARYHPVNDCHEMVIDKKGRILLLTNHTKNNVIIYDQKGKLLETWGTDYPGAHGLTLHNENGIEYLYICDNTLHEVIKTDLSGKIILRLPWPQETREYTSADQYVPTESAIADNGDIYISDGYGAQYILHYSADGQLKNIFGGRGGEPDQFQNAHGICIDTRNTPHTLLITERAGNHLKRFTLSGELIEIINLPGAYICRPVIHNNEVYLATIWSGEKMPNSGFISILNHENQLVSAPGGIAPIYQNGVLQPMQQSLKIFQHPHDVCIDNDDNIYVAQWNSGQTYPIKMIRV